MMGVKHYYDTGQGLHKRDRAQSETKAQKEYEYHLQAEARRTLERLRAEGKREVVIHYSNSYDAANRGLTVMPNPRITETGHLAWTVR
jgi:hypothetical protein